MANNNNQEIQQERKDRLTAAQALVERSLAPVEHAPSQIVSTFLAPPTSSPVRADSHHTMPVPSYSERSNHEPTFIRNTRTTAATPDNPHLTYLHPSTSAFARRPFTQPQTQTQPLSTPSSPLTTTLTTTTEFPKPHSATAKSHIQTPLEEPEPSTIEPQEAALILMTMHFADRSLAQNRADLNLLDVGGSGRSGLRSRGVTVRRRGAEHVDERLSMEEVGPGVVGSDDSGSSLTSLEESDGVKEGDGDKGTEDDECEATSRGPRGDDKTKGKGKGEKKPRIAKKKKMAFGALGDYQRHSVRDGKGRFIKK